MPRVGLIKATAHCALVSGIGQIAATTPTAPRPSPPFGVAGNLSRAASIVPLHNANGCRCLLSGKVNIYLDIDGVLLRDGTPTAHCFAFLRWAVESHRPHWLTTRDAHGQHAGILRDFRHAMGSPELPSEIEALLKAVRPTRWSLSKVSGIDLASDFVWIDDAPLAVEIEALRGRGLLDRLCLSQMRREVVRHFDGFVAQYLSDGVLVYSGYPEAHEPPFSFAVTSFLAEYKAAPCPSLHFLRPIDIQAKGLGLSITGRKESRVGLNAERRDFLAGAKGRNRRGQFSWPFHLVRIDYDRRGGCQGLLHQGHGLGRAGRIRVR